MKEEFKSGLPLKNDEMPPCGSVEDSLRRFDEAFKRTSQRRFKRATPKQVKDARELAQRICGEHDD